MDDFSEYVIYRQTFNTQKLIEDYPPTLFHLNKKVVYQIACPPGSVHQGELEFSRWHPMELPERLPLTKTPTQFKARPGYFDYESSNLKPNAVEWYLNFADAHLFYAYAGGLFAQDEMQVAEHPALASLREALLDANIEPLTVEHEETTPILIRGVERRCAIATNPDAEEGRPLGLYGNHFAQAKAATIRIATMPLNPPTVTNILAIQAPPGCSGAYTYEQIEFILTTAFTGFSAAKWESQLVHPEATVTIHTGFWGCGAYGGNRVLMALLQLLAARLAEVNDLIFYVGGIEGVEALKTAHQILKQDLEIDHSEVPVSDLLMTLEEMDFQWGVSDGN